MRRAALGALLLLAACAAPAEPDAATSAARQAILARAQGTGALVRAAPLCRLPLSMAAQDRAARLETTVLALHQLQGGTAERDAFLHGLEPPAFDPHRHGRDREAWCSARQAEIARLDLMLAGAEGEAPGRRGGGGRGGRALGEGCPSP